MYFLGFSLSSSLVFGFQQSHYDFFFLCVLPGMLVDLWIWGFVSFISFGSVLVIISYHSGSFFRPLGPLFIYMHERLFHCGSRGSNFFSISIFKILGWLCLDIPKWLAFQFSIPVFCIFYLLLNSMKVCIISDGIFFHSRIFMLVSLVDYHSLVNVWCIW